jgi:hypothetical protein
MNILSAIGSLASIISLYKQEGREKVKEKINKKQGRVFTVEVQETISISDNVDINAKLREVIDGALLEAIHAKIDNRHYAKLINLHFVKP